jgi:hypothetical protein
MLLSFSVKLVLFCNDTNLFFILFDWTIALSETFDGDNRQYNSENELAGASPLPIELSLQFLKDITKNFCSELEISQGVSGVVYQVCSIIAAYWS